MSREEWPGDDASWMVEAERVERYNRSGSHLETDCQITYARMLPNRQAVRPPELPDPERPRTVIGNYREFHRQFRQEVDSFANALRQCGCRAWNC